MTTRSSGILVAGHIVDLLGIPAADVTVSVGTGSTVTAGATSSP
jgi:hypothetical protein